MPMHELVAVFESEATRELKLKNIDTETVDICFDDSALLGTKNFYFMTIGNYYDCKILLFGKPFLRKSDDATMCRVVGENIAIGNLPVIKVEIESNFYYIKESDISGIYGLNQFYFRISRKDLVQVNNVVHPYLLS